VPHPWLAWRTKGPHQGPSARAAPISGLRAGPPAASTDRGGKRPPCSLLVPIMLILGTKGLRGRPKLTRDAWDRQDDGTPRIDRFHDRQRSLLLPRRAERGLRLIEANGNAGPFARRFDEAAGLIGVRPDG
jgi:hypothetical protein